VGAKIPEISYEAAIRNKSEDDDETTVERDYGGSELLSISSN